MNFGTCDGCNGPLDLLGAMGKYAVCMDCVKARHRTATTGGACKCGRKKRPGEVVKTGGYFVNGTRRGGRSFIPCNRCLGNIKTLS